GHPARSVFAKANPLLLVDRFGPLMLYRVMRLSPEKGVEPAIRIVGRNTRRLLVAIIGERFPEFRLRETPERHTQAGVVRVIDRGANVRIGFRLGVVVEKTSLEGLIGAIASDAKVAIHTPRLVGAASIGRAATRPGIEPVHVSHEE